MPRSFEIPASLRWSVGLILAGIGVAAIVRGEVVAGGVFVVLGLSFIPRSLRVPARLAVPPADSGELAPFLTQLRSEAVIFGGVAVVALLAAIATLGALIEPESPTLTAGLLLLIAGGCGWIAYRGLTATPERIRHELGDHPILEQPPKRD